MRLAKYIAHAGVASRRAAEELIAKGRVTLDGEVIRDPAFGVVDGARVSVDGRPLHGPEAPVAYALHKPVGVVSTARDTHGRPTVVDLVRDTGVRLYPVGRLDADSSGLILLTNDGELANRLMHPRYGVPKTYRARVGGGPVREVDLRRLGTGVTLEDGRTGPAKVRRVQRDPRRGDLLEITITEGRKRQVRRMCEAVGHPVRALERVGFGPLTLGELKAGKHRRLGKAARDAASRRRGGRDAPAHASPSETIAGMRLFALRGAISVPRNDSDEIVAATTELMNEIMFRNDLEPERVVSCIFTATEDLNAQFPAVAARALGYDNVPLLCAREIPVPGALERVIRVLIHYEADDAHVPHHVYLGEASTLRADLQAAQ